MSDTDFGMDFDPISRALETETPIGSLPRPKDQLPAPSEPQEAPEIEEDFQEARSNMKELIGQAMEQMPDLINLMSQSQDAKMISAVSGWMKTAADLNTSLSKLSKEIKRQPKAEKETAGESQSGGPSMAGAVYIGTTEDFLKTLNKRKDADAVDVEYKEVE